jgi:putative colanic acid biosynthesis UDP-glucose lipid carrier transferase
MRRPLSFYLQLIFLLGDLAILNAAVLIVDLLFATSENLFNKVLLIFLSIVNSLWLILALLINPYKFSRVSRFVKVLRVHFSFVVMHFLTVLSTLFIINVVEISVSRLAAVFGTAVALLFCWRVLYFYLNRIFINKKLNAKNVVIVGFGDLAWEMRKFFRLHPEYGYRFLGYFDQRVENSEVNSLDKLEAFCQDNSVHEIYCCLPYLENNKVKNLVDYGLSNLIKVKLITDYRGFFARGISLQRYDRIPVLNIAAIPLDEKTNQTVKRAFDIVFSLIVITFFLSWAGSIIALLIKLDSKGPVLFKQKRTGKGNKDFWCLKFRTMYVNNDSDVKQATKGDNRITPIGAFLRKTSLDEFPQFFNVLAGSMSVVGPRPHMLVHTEKYSRIINKFMARHYIKPGITGLAQAKGFRGETQHESAMRGRVKLDRFYIENWTFLLDLKIIFATVVSLAKGDQQAY